MSALEQEIIDKFHQLKLAAKQRVRALIEQELNRELQQAKTSEFDYAVWLRNIESLRAQIRTDHNSNIPSINVVGILRDLRDGEDE